MTNNECLKLVASDDIVRVRQAVRNRMIEMKYSLVDQTKVVTAVSELARNAISYGGGGIATLETLYHDGRMGLRVVFEDKGPGIKDINLAMTDGYSTSGGLGLGLGGSKRLVDEFELWSQPGQGTRITLTKWKL